MRSRYFSALLTAVVISAPASLVSAEIPADNIIDALCRKDQHKTLTRLGRDSLNELVKCHKQRITGRIDAATDCNDLANAPSSLRISREQQKVTKRVDIACNGNRRPAASEPIALGYGSCNAPCDSVDIGNTYAGQTACILCLAQAHVESLSTSIFGTPPVPLSKNERRCQNKIAGAAKSYFAKRVGIQARCQTSKDLGKIDLGTDCKADDARGKMVRARTTLGKAINRCSDADLAALDGCGGSVAATQACVLAAVEGAADALFDAVYPPIPDPPTPTATVTDTPEATETPTATPDRCSTTECSLETDCLAASKCDPTSGKCGVQPPINDGNACTDGNNSGTCSEGTCKVDPCFGVNCPKETACLFGSKCSDSKCSKQGAKKNGTFCTDGNNSGSCFDGFCQTDPCFGVSCPKEAQCLFASECFGGKCGVQQPKKVGTQCDDNNSATINDICNGKGGCFGDAGSNASAIIVYNTNSSFVGGGGIGSRASTTSICGFATPKSVSCDGNSTALLSYTADAIRDLPGKTGWPTNVPIKSASGVSLATDWSDFTDGSWSNTVGTAFGGIAAWTGSDANGSQIENCKDWTDTNSTGSITGSAASSFQAGKGVCDLTFDILCACEGSSEGGTVPAACTSQPLPLKNGKFFCKLPVPSGEKCLHSCDTTYNASGSALCTDGNWSSTATCTSSSCSSIGNSVICEATNGCTWAKGCIDLPF